MGGIVYGLVGGEFEWHAVALRSSKTTVRLGNSFRRMNSSAARVDRKVEPTDAVLSLVANTGFGNLLLCGKSTVDGKGAGALDHDGQIVRGVDELAEHRHVLLCFRWKDGTRGNTDSTSNPPR